MDPNTKRQQPTTAPNTAPIVRGPTEVWMEIPIVTIPEVTDQEPSPPQGNNHNSNTTTAALRGGDDVYDDYYDCCEGCCSSMVICLRCWLCCGCHYDD
ncbi:hypothetical protein PG993_007713 [Apiospora rasikravindrae]|uniref:Uncharacterized protein n=1 Tax=Apiospora rasikravindrae TaxID=990691 RepID=A0ABR1SY98_9PEZI